MTWLARGLMCSLLIAAYAPPGFAAQCLSEGASVTLSGVVSLAKASNVHDGRRYTYPVLMLDKPVCYRSAAMGDVSKARLVAIIAGETTPQRFRDMAGRHVTVQGTVMHSSTMDQPPQKLLLFRPRLAR
ncbi:MAG: hypothetical protein KGJ79_18610 [Alphaproteobacteria bacterium]|nr:hypothetical protein [Alphaproteobacteria bacterium]MDE2113148.1 hypothetical protein [Alphaproteobacteria bacterium]MDE2494019.1 hypothetical protein [Alphaproteobacteria bacterium]